MAISEHRRHELHQHLEEVLGAEQAATLMEYLPPIGWADVATKRDIDATNRDLNATIEHVETMLRLEIKNSELSVRGEIETVRTEMHKMGENLQREMRVQLLAGISANAAFMGLLVAAMKLA